MGFTKTQRFILYTLRTSPTGRVSFGRGDRKGTRVASWGGPGVPVIIAYQAPEFFLASRGLIDKADGPHTYRLTPAGVEAARSIEWP